MDSPEIPEISDRRFRQLHEFYEPWKNLTREGNGREQSHNAKVLLDNQRG
ncbi:hypothetical protein [Leptolyngbya sp. NIES-2104]|nr:hypothetical protein [Leptolyngbya sp. NIES-2104]GAP98432.1 hypothetical protein NIES2104_49870 [Leptolyngbya sp. NIES-2104]